MLLTIKVCKLVDTTIFLLPLFGHSTNDAIEEINTILCQQRIIERETEHIIQHDTLHEGLQFIRSLLYHLWAILLNGLINFNVHQEFREIVMHQTKGDACTNGFCTIDVLPVFLEPLKIGGKTIE